MAGILLNRNRQVPAEETPAFGGIAERFRRAGDLDRAIALCRDGLQRFPEQLSARVTLGWALLDKGQYDAARDELEQVLRKAPDNLAAIRGLAELHDRSEGAISAAEQESWRAPETSASEPPVTEIVAAADTVHLAPIQVALSDDAPDEAPGLLQTAAAAGLEAAGADVIDEVASVPAPQVELEDPAAASMAAADPAPFFVDAVDTAAPSEAFDAFDAGELDLLAEAAALEVDAPAQSAVDLSLAAEPSDEALLAAAAALEDEAEFEAAGIIVETPDNGAQDQVPVMFDAGAVETEPAWAATAPAAEPPTEDAAAIASIPVETLDDVDEEAGAELADAIKALEAAARRVEKKLAPAPASIEPAASPEDIAAFEFFDRAQAADAVDVADEVGTSLVDVHHDGSFELVAPDLAAVELESPAEAAIDAVVGPAADDETVDVYAALLAFDAPDDATPGIDATPGDTDAEASDVVVALDAEAGVPGLDSDAAQAALDAVFSRSADPSASPGVDLDTFDDVVVDMGVIADGAGAESSPASDAALVQALVEAPDDATEGPDAADEPAQPIADVAVTTPDFAASDDDEPPAAAAEATGSRVVAFEVVRSRGVAPEPDVEAVAVDAAVDEPVVDEADVEVAAVSDEEDDVDAAIAALETSEPPRAAGAVVVAPVLVTPALARRHKTIAALERFLRQVQARKLALQTETVA